jgi:hypothetical protein
MNHFTIPRKAYLSLLVILTFVTICFAATYTVNNSCTTCNWSTNSTWMGGAVPPSNGSHTVNVNGSVVVTSVGSMSGFAAINLNSGKSFTSGSIGTPNNLTLQSLNFNIVNGVMTVYGDLTLNSSANLTLTSGSLVVTGTLRLNGGTLSVANNQNVTVGNLVITTSGGSSLTNNGNITVNGNVSQSGPINNSATGSITVNGNYTTGGGSLTNNGDITITGNVSQSNPIINGAAGSITINGDHTMVNSGSATFTNTGDYHVAGDLTVPGGAKFYVNPGGETFVDGSVTVTSNQNLIVGTNANPPPYADMVIREDLTMNGGGAIINKNGRFAVFGDVDSNNSGGTTFTIKSGGQVYVDGDMKFKGGGDHVVNENAASPYGFYTDGDVTYKPNSGSGTTGHAEGSITDMYNEDRPFYDWVSGIPDGPLPILLLYFKANATASGIALQWVTTFEKNFNYFEIERAGTDLHFTAIARIDAKGGIGINTVYDFIDESPLMGNNYYRLKSIDYDNSFEYSPVVFGSWNTSDGVVIYPNPVVEKKFTIQLNDRIGSPAYIQLFEASGTMLFSDEFTGDVREVTLPDNVKPGFYLLKISSRQKQEVINVVVQ